MTKTKKVKNPRIKITFLETGVAINARRISNKHVKKAIKTLQYTLDEQSHQRQMEDLPPEVADALESLFAKMHEK